MVLEKSSFHSPDELIIVIFVWGIRQSVVSPLGQQVHTQTLSLFVPCTRFLQLEIYRPS